MINHLIKSVKEAWKISAHGGIPYDHGHDFSRNFIWYNHVRGKRKWINPV